MSLNRGFDGPHSVVKLVVSLRYQPTYSALNTLSNYSL